MARATLSAPQSRFRTANYYRRIVSPGRALICSQVIKKGQGIVAFRGQVITQDEHNELSTRLCVPGDNEFFNLITLPINIKSSGVESSFWVVVALYLSSKYWDKNLSVITDVSNILEKCVQ